MPLVGGADLNGTPSGDPTDLYGSTAHIHIGRVRPAYNKVAIAVKKRGKSVRRAQRQVAIAILVPRGAGARRAEGQQRRTPSGAPIVRYELDTDIP
eukprot:6173027-Pleurochrysis_carterae.AAC.2